MNVGDYTAKVNAARDRYNDAATKLRDEYKNNTEKQDQMHELREKKQADNYDKSIQEKEKDVQRLNQQYSQKTQDELNKRREQFQKEVGIRREAFEDENRRLRTDLSERLEGIKEEYDQMTRDKDKTTNEMLADMARRHHRSETMRSQEYNKQIESLNQRSKDSLNELAESEAQDKRDLLEAHRKEVQDKILNHTLSTNRINTKHQEMIEQIRSVHDSEKQSMNDYHDGLVDNIRNQNKKEADEMRQNFENLTSSIQDRGKREQDKLIYDNKQTIKDMEQQFDKDYHALNRKTNAVINSTGHGDSAKTELLRERAANEKRVEALKSNIEEMREQDRLGREKADQMHKESMRAQNLAALAIRDKLEKENNDYNREVVGKTRMEKDDAIEQYTKQLYDLRKDTEAQIIHESNQSKKLLENQRAEFARSVNQMTEKNLLESEETRQAHSQATKDLIETNRLHNFNEKEDLKEQYTDKIDRLTMSHDQVLEQRNKEIKSLKEYYENKVALISKKSADEIKKQKEFEEQRRVEDQRSTRREMEHRESAHNAEVKKIRDGFAITLDKTKSEYDSQMARMMREYEDKLIFQQQEHERDMNLKLGEARENYEKLAVQSQMQLETQRSQYESKIDKMRLTNNQNLEMISRRQTQKES